MKYPRNCYNNMLKNFKQNKNSLNLLNYKKQFQVKYITKHQKRH